MPRENTINVVDALRGQQEQLRRLIAQRAWISQASRPILCDLEAHLAELRRLITQLETDIRDQLDKSS
jgi:hypothetical protein